MSGGLGAAAEFRAQLAVARAALAQYDGEGASATSAASSPPVDYASWSVRLYLVLAGLVAAIDALPGLPPGDAR